MKVPSIWVGFGEYGRLAVEEMQLRLELVRSIKELEPGGEPILFHVPLEGGKRSDTVRSAGGWAGADLGQEFNDFADATALHAAVRRGNQDRDQPFVMAIAEASEVAGVLPPDAFGWVWGLSDELDLGAAVLVFILGTDTRGPEDSRTTIIQEFVNDCAVKPAEAKGNSYRLIALDASEDETRPAIPLLFELMMRLPGNPGAPVDGQLTVLGALLRGAGAQSIGSFAIRAFGVDVVAERERATAQLTDDLMKLLQDGNRKGNELGELPAGAIDLPKIAQIGSGTETAAWAWEPAFLDDYRDASDAFLHQFASLEHALARWREDIQIDSLDASGTEEQALAIVADRRVWLQTQVSQAWASGRGFKGLTDTIEGIRALSKSESPMQGESGDQRSAAPASAEPPPLAGDYPRMRERMLARMSLRPSPANAIVFAVFLAAVGAVGGFAAASLAGEAGPVDFTQPLVLALAAIAGAALAAVGSVVSWLVTPWRDVREANDAIANELIREKRAGDQYQTLVRQVVRGAFVNDVFAAFEADLARVSEEIRDGTEVANAFFAGRLPVRAAPGRSSLPVNIYEGGSIDRGDIHGGEMLEGAIPGPEAIEASFLGRFTPIYPTNDGRTYCPAALLPEAAREIAGGHVAEALRRDAPFAKFRVRSDDGQGIHPLGGDPGTTEIFAPARAEVDADGEAVQNVRGLLRYGDKAYLVSAGSRPLPEPVMAAAGRRPRRVPPTGVA